MKQYKNTVQTIQNTINTCTHITKTPTRTHTHTLQNKLKQIQYKLKRPQYKISKRNSHNIITYPQYKVTICTWHFYPQELRRNSLHLKIKSLHINHVSSLHITTLHDISLIYTQSPPEFSCLYSLTNDRIVKQVKKSRRK